MRTPHQTICGTPIRILRPIRRLIPPDTLLEPANIVPFSGSPIRHLMFFVYPKGDWKSSTIPMLDRMSQFQDGKRILAVAYDSLSEVAEVSQFCGSAFTEILPCANIKELREVVAWLPCLQRLLSDDRNSMIFTAHAKGVSHKDRPEIARWIREMFEINLDYPSAIEREMDRNAMCGAFRRTGQFPKIAHTKSEANALERWHYSGTFYWIRSYALFARNWRNMDWAWYGTESYPGTQFRSQDCSCLVGDWCDDLYQKPTWEKLDLEISKWKKSQ